MVLGLTHRALLKKILELQYCSNVVQRLYHPSHFIERSCLPKGRPHERKIRYFAEG
jgi:hypothetical protein